MRTTGDPTGLSGSVIRIDPTTGAAAAGNPLGGDANAKRIIAYGLRDSTRLAFRPGTNDIWVTDRGGGYFEEINRDRLVLEAAQLRLAVLRERRIRASRATCRT